MSNKFDITLQWQGVVYLPTWESHQYFPAHILKLVSFGSTEWTLPDCFCLTLQWVVGTKDLALSHKPCTFSHPSLATGVIIRWWIASPVDDDWLGKFHKFPNSRPALFSRNVMPTTSRIQNCLIATFKKLKPLKITLEIHDNISNQNY